MTDEEIEEWRPSREFPGLYEVSSLGRVRSLDRRIPNTLTGGTSLIKGRVLIGRIRKDGYREYLISIEDVRHYRNWHRMVAEAFLGGPPSQEQRFVLHGDNNRSNNRISNLRWGSHSENMRDKAIHGTDPMLNKTHCPQGHPYAGENLIYDSGYRRCRTCRNSRSKAASKNRRKQGLPDDDPRHGTRLGYNTYGCFCDPCKAAQREYYQTHKTVKAND